MKHWGNKTLSYKSLLFHHLTLGVLSFQSNLQYGYTYGGVDHSSFERSEIGMKF